MGDAMEFSAVCCCGGMQAQRGEGMHTTRLAAAGRTPPFSGNPLPTERCVILGYLGLNGTPTFGAHFRKSVPQNLCLEIF